MKPKRWSKRGGEIRVFRPNILGGPKIVYEISSRAGTFAATSGGEHGPWRTLRHEYNLSNCQFLEIMPTCVTSEPGNLPPPGGSLALYRALR